MEYQHCNLELSAIDNDRRSDVRAALDRVGYLHMQQMSGNACRKHRTLAQDNDPIETEDKYSEEPRHNVGTGAALKVRSSRRMLSDFQQDCW